MEEEGETVVLEKGIEENASTALAVEDEEETVELEKGVEEDASTLVVLLKPVSLNDLRPTGYVAVARAATCRHASSLKKSEPHSL